MAPCRTDFFSLKSSSNSIPRTLDSGGNQNRAHKIRSFFVLAFGGPNLFAYFPPVVTSEFVFAQGGRPNASVPVLLETPNTPLSLFGLILVPHKGLQSVNAPVAILKPPWRVWREDSGPLLSNVCHGCHTLFVMPQCVVATMTDLLGLTSEAMITRHCF